MKRYGIEDNGLLVLWVIKYIRLVNPHSELGTC